MLSNAKEKIIQQLHTNKGRQKHGLCLVEGPNSIAMAQDFIDFTFTPADTEKFNQLLTTEKPQDMAAVAHIPEWSIDDVLKHNMVLILDHIQEPGNVGTILRLALAFKAGVFLVNCADTTNPKAIRSATGAQFKIPWAQLKNNDLEKIVTEHKRIVYRLEKTESNAINLTTATILDTPNFIVIGNEGNGIQLPVQGQSLAIPHTTDLDSINVSQAVAILLFTQYNKKS